MEAQHPIDESLKKAMDGVAEELKYQKQKWGTDHDKQHSPEDWLTILTIWLGKLGQETPMFAGDDWHELPKFLKRLDQIAAIAISAKATLLEKSQKLPPR
jgi:hypothetical protein